MALLEQNTLKFFPCAAKKAIGKIFCALGLLSRERYLPLQVIYRARKRELSRPITPNPAEFIFFELGNDRGIGNRLKVIVSNLRFYRGQKIACIWPTNGWVTADLHELFDIKDFTVETLPEKPNVLPWKISKNRAIYREIGEGSDIWADGDELVENIESFGTYEKTAESAKRIYGEIFGHFRPSEAVSARLKSITPPPQNSFLFKLDATKTGKQREESIPSRFILRKWTRSRQKHDFSFLRSTKKLLQSCANATEIAFSSFRRKITTRWLMLSPICSCWLTGTSGFTRLAPLFQKSRGGSAARNKKFLSSATKKFATSNRIHA